MGIREVDEVKGETAFKRLLTRGAAFCLFVLAFAFWGNDRPALAQTPGEPTADGGYTLTWWTVDGGGRTVGSGEYTLSSTAGQPDAETVAGGDYTLIGGFWGGAEQSLRYYHTYLPLVVRSAP